MQRPIGMGSVPGRPKRRRSSLTGYSKGITIFLRGLKNIEHPATPTPSNLYGASCIDKQRYTHS